jgi:hypothetical protein
MTRILGLFFLAGSLLAQAPSTEAPAAQAPSTQPSAEAPAATAPSEQVSMRPVGTMSELMVNIIYPTSDAIFYISTRVPKNDVQWNTLKSQAQMLGESANLLMMPGFGRPQDRWMKDAKLLLDAGTAAFRAAKAKDVAALTALNDQLYTSCVTCHADYRPNYRRPAAAPPPPAGASRP